MVMVRMYEGYASKYGAHTYTYTYIGRGSYRHIKAIVIATRLNTRHMCIF